MRRLATLLFFVSLLPLLTLAQKYKIYGSVTDATTGETLIGATVLYGEGKGVITDLQGNFTFKVDKGTYHLKVSYVGYLPEEKDVVVSNADVTLNFILKTPTLTEVEVIGDVAKARETPVAFSNISPIQIQEQLASRDIPMILNKTPGVYATQQGGGDGDARINVRGFSQRNLAVMLDGIPVNDMENGWVYWSNWFGLDAVTRSIQIQRGLGASKLALPSVGGTMNIITKGMEAKLGGTVKQEVGSDGFLRTLIGLSSGPLKHGWNFSLAGSYKRGNGWVDQTWTNAWFFYLRVDKKIGNHTLTFSAMGAPQQHGQRSYQQSIKTFDSAYARKLGDTTANTGENRGIRYNPNWGYLNRWTYGSNDEHVPNAKTEDLMQSKNYYFKPQFSLRDFWHVNDRLYISNIVYLSLGNGGGTGYASSDNNGTPSGSTPPTDPSNGQVYFQPLYDANMANSQGKSLYILRSSINNHKWIGLLSTFNWEVTPNITFSGGIDLRTYRAQHYMEIYDLLGGNYFLDNVDQSRNSQTKLYTGDKIRYDNDGLIRWGGLFAMAEYKKNNWSAFLNLTGAMSGYKRIDYYLNKDVTVDGKTYEQVIGYGDILLQNDAGYVVKHASDSMWTSNDTVHVSNGSNSYSIYNPRQFTINSPEASTTETYWNWFPGFTVKGGVNYNINKHNSVFLNLGYLSKAPRFNNVYDRYNKLVHDIRNEIVESVELGYNLNTNNISLDVNAYFTNWQNRPMDFIPSTTIDGVNYPYNVNGIDAIHKGIEVEFGWKPFSFLQWDQVLSLGDWKWNSGDTAKVYNDAGQLISTFYFDAKGVHVGDAAQFQWMESLRWEIIKSLYVSASFTYFGKNYSELDPSSLETTPRDSWKMPNYYTFDANAGYRFTFKKFKLDIRGSVLNVLNREYISDATNNDSYSTSTKGFDAASAGVFFGPGRTFNFAIGLTY